MSYLIINESLTTAGRNIVDFFKTFGDSKAWANNSDGWNNILKRNKENFNTRFDFSKISKKVVQMIQKYHPAVFSSAELDKMMNSRLWTKDNQGYTQYSTGATDVFNKAEFGNNLNRHPFYNLGHKIFLKRLHGPRGINLVVVHFDSDGIDKLDVVVDNRQSGLSVKEVTEMKQIPVDEYKKG